MSAQRIGEDYENLEFLFCKQFNFLSSVTKTEDGRYVIVNADGRSIPLKLATTSKETIEPKKYVVKCEFAFSNLTLVRS